MSLSNIFKKPQQTNKHNKLYVFDCYYTKDVVPLFDDPEKKYIYLKNVMKEILGPAYY